jgi:hypothetical protein
LKRVFRLELAVTSGLMFTMIRFALLAAAASTRFRWYSEGLIVTQQALVWWPIAVAPLRIRSVEANSGVF